MGSRITRNGRLRESEGTLSSGMTQTEGGPPSSNTQTLSKNWLVKITMMVQTSDKPHIFSKRVFDPIAAEGNGSNNCDLQ
jgi:hypothetical protein